MDLAIFSQGDFTKDSAPFIAQLDQVEDLVAFQETINRRLDEIETELMDEVNKQSAVFFQALAVVEDIQATLSGLSSATGQVKSQIEDFDERLSSEYTKLEAIYTQQRNLQRVLDELALLDQIYKLRRKVQELVNMCSFDEALFLIRKLQEEMLPTFPDDFAPLNALRSEIMEMKLAIEKMNSSPDVSANPIK